MTIGSERRTRADDPQQLHSASAVVLVARNRCLPSRDATESGPQFSDAFRCHCARPTPVPNANRIAIEQCASLSQCAVLTQRNDKNVHRTVMQCAEQRIKASGDTKLMNEVGAMLPDLYLHGVALGDFEASKLSRSRSSWCLTSVVRNSAATSCARSCSYRSCLRCMMYGGSDSRAARVTNQHRKSADTKAGESVSVRGHLPDSLSGSHSRGSAPSGPS